MKSLPNCIDSGRQGPFHVQGICLDRAREAIYFSFTTSLVKCDLSGKVIGSVRGLTGHLGCIALNPEDGKIYGSLEYKNDAIGQGILAGLGRAGDTHEDAFYVAVFDGDRITRRDMDAEKDGVMKTVYLKTVVDDYRARVTNRGVSVPHRYGCSGIDGITFAPIPGAGKDAPRFLFVACGVYGDKERTDNDYQLLLRYDIAGWETLARPLNAEQPHTSGPEAPAERYFVLTGNTNWGVQNLEYDPFTGNLLMAVYEGTKADQRCYPLYVVDGSKAPVRRTLRGVEPPTEGWELTLLGGSDFPLGSTGLFALGDGTFYISENRRDAEGQESSLVRRYTWEDLFPSE